MADKPMADGSKTPEQLHHSHVVRIRRVIVLRDLEVRLRRLENERHSLRATIAQQPAKRLDADLPIANEHVTILVRAEPTFTVVQVKEARRLGRRRLEL